MREICIFGLGDLPWLFRRPELFVNKFYADFEPLAYDCMEELIFNRTLAPLHVPDMEFDISEIMDDKEDDFDPSYYERLAFVANKSSAVVPLAETLEYLETNV